ncbi:MAG: hypothetical protein FWC42_11110 [Proteobacteria bacterium]|nr:hypothetical protein [Pseudomonadota bacterium]
MARIRTIKPEFPQSESMGRVSREARLCFILLWTVADDAGRLRGNSRMLAGVLYPYDDDAKKHIDGWLTELSSEGCIARYEVDGTSYIEVTNWSEHQKIDKPSASKLPAFIEPSRTFANLREDSTMDQERKGREGKGREKERKSSAEPQSDSPPLLTLPLVDGNEHPVTQEDVDEWAKAYPAVNVEQALHQMRSWLMANKSNRKTARGINAFIVRWLGKNQDSAPRAATPAHATLLSPNGTSRTNGAAPKSFAQQDREAGWLRWEQQTGEVHPDRARYCEVAAVIDVEASPAPQLEAAP